MRVYDTLQKLPTSHLLAKAWQRTPISWDNSGWERPTVWHATYWIVTVDKVVKESDHENGIFFLRLLACALRFFCIRVFTITVFPDSGILLYFRLTALTWESIAISSNKIRYFQKCLHSTFQVLNEKQIPKLTDS